MKSTISLNFLRKHDLKPPYQACIYIISCHTKKCDIDLKRQMRKFYANINILSRKFAKCSPDKKYTLDTVQFLFCF